MSAVFADTSYFLALLNREDVFHRRALNFALRSPRLFTTEFIVLELGNACSRAEDHADFLALLAGLKASPRVSIAPLSSELLDAGIRLMAERPDKHWSLTDCTSFQIMKREGLGEALTADQHFEQAGFSALLR